MINELSNDMTAEPARGASSLPRANKRVSKNVKVALVCRSEAGPINHAVGIFHFIQCFGMVAGTERFKRSNWLCYVKESIVL